MSIQLLLILSITENLIIMIKQKNCLKSLGMINSIKTHYFSENMHFEHFYNNWNKQKDHFPDNIDWVGLDL